MTPLMSNKITNDVIIPLDSELILNILPKELENNIFHQLKKECNWVEMRHRGGTVPRLVCIQGDINEDGDEPIYRHPVDAQPPLHQFSPTVQKIINIVSAIIGHKLNHALIQLYRSGTDYISEHADKTIDVKHGSNIVNLSIGALRTMVLRPKRENNKGKTPKPRTNIKIPLPHNSLFILGWNTNLKMTHAIKQDKRPISQKTTEELAYNGERISLTLRNVATYITKNGNLYGQGACNKTKLKKEYKKKKKSSVNTGDIEEQQQLLLNAFSLENRSSDFDWDQNYGKGFDQLTFSAINGNNDVASKKNFNSGNKTRAVFALFVSFLILNGLRHSI